MQAHQEILEGTYSRRANMAFRSSICRNFLLYLLFVISSDIKTTRWSMIEMTKYANCGHPIFEYKGHYYHIFVQDEPNKEETGYADIGKDCYEMNKKGNAECSCKNPEPSSKEEEK